MRQTPAQRHRMHSLASQQVAQHEADNAHGQTVGTAYELQLAQLHQHRLRLKDIVGARDVDAALREKAGVFLHALELEGRAAGY